MAHRTFSRAIRRMGFASAPRRRGLSLTCPSCRFRAVGRPSRGRGEEPSLAPHQVAGPRHAQHFNRFYEQVLGLDGSFEDRLARARLDLNPAFIEMFDNVLVEWGRRLVENPRDLEAKVDFVTLYHMIIEGTLALTGQFFLTDY